MNRETSLLKSTGGANALSQTEEEKAAAMDWVVMEAPQISHLC